MPDQGGHHTTRKGFGVLDTSFAPLRKLAAAAAVLALGAVGTLVASPQANAAESETVIESPQITWNYLDDGTDPVAGADNPDAWAAVDFDDSSWPADTGSFGALRGEIGQLSGGYTPKTLLSQYVDGTTTNKPAFFFRTTLDVPHVADLATVAVELRYDDAVSLFVNGTYVGGGDDAALQADPKRNTTHGGSNASAPKLATVQIPTELLNEGTNTFAMRLHNGRPTSSDLYLDVERITLRTKDAAPTWEEQLRTSDVSNVILGVGATPNTQNLVWYTDLEHSNAPAVELVEASQLVDGAFPASGAVTFDASQIDTEDALQGLSRGFEAKVNKVTFENLKADTTYAYRIGDNGRWLRQYQFTTEKDSDRWSFFFTGDPQIGAASGHRGVNPMERSWVADSWGWNETMKTATATFPGIRTHVSAGDQVESSSRLTPELYNSPVNKTETEYLGYSYPEALKTLQNAPTLGNHDYYVGGRATYAQHYNHPNFDKETWNSWWAQNNVLFLHLNTEFNNPANGHVELHDAWLTRILAEQGDKYDHHIAVMHRPPYSVGPHSVSSTTNRVRDTFVPLFKKHGLNALMTGHDHTYARSHIVDGFNAQFDGATSTWSVTGEVIDLGTGTEAPDEVFLTDDQMVSIVANSASGSKYYDIQDVNHPYLAVQNQDFMRSYTVVDIDECSLSYTTLRAENHPTDPTKTEGSVIDKVRVNMPFAAPSIEDAAPLTVKQSDVDGLDLMQGLEYSVCNAERFPVEVQGTVDAQLLEQPQTITYTIAAGTPWEVTATRTVVVEGDPVDPDPTPTPDPTPDPTPAPDPTPDPTPTPDPSADPSDDPTVKPGDNQGKPKPRPGLPKTGV